MQILIFIGLKIVEIIIIAGLPYLVGRFILRDCLSYAPKEFLISWLEGLACIVGIIAIWGILYLFIGYNRECAGKLMQTIGK